MPYMRPPSGAVAPRYNLILVARDGKVMVADVDVGSMQAEGWSLTDSPSPPAAPPVPYDLDDEDEETKQ